MCRESLNQTVLVPKAIINACYRMTLQEKRIVWCLFTKIPLTEPSVDVPLTLTNLELAEYLQLQAGEASSMLQKAVKSLKDKTLTTCEDNIVKGTYHLDLSTAQTFKWFKDIKIRKEKKELVGEFYFSKEVLTHFCLFHR
jgi:hypothetical protein